MKTCRLTPGVECGVVVQHYVGSPPQSFRVRPIASLRIQTSAIWLYAFFDPWWIKELGGNAEEIGQTGRQTARDSESALTLLKIINR